MRFVVWDMNNEWCSSERVEVLKATDYTGEEAAQYALDRAPCTLVMDEVDAVAPNHRGGLQEGTAMHSIVHYGRHYGNGRGVAMLCAARRSGSVHIDIRALADVIFYFRHIEPNDLHWIADVSGERWADAVRALPPRQFLRCEL